MPGTRSVASLVTAIALVLAVSGCTGTSPDQGTDPDTGRAAPRSTQATRVYVAVGASETVGVGADDPATQAWPRVLRDTALRGAELVDVGVSGATVRDALATQLAPALAAEPDLVTVWLAVNDAVSLVPVADYERQLTRLVHALRRGGRTEVLVGNMPRLDRLPAYRACLPGATETEVSCLLPLVPPPAQVRRMVAEFNAAIARVVRREGAVPVDLSGQRDLAGLTGADGFHPSTAGHREVARTFAEALGGG
jgi:lysophospholipase L1-like esterase